MEQDGLKHIDPNAFGCITVNTFMTVIGEVISRKYQQHKQFFFLA